MISKKELRTELLSVRNALSAEEVLRHSELVFNRLQEVCLAKMKVNTLHSYLAFRNEIDTYTFLTSAIEKGLTVAVPKTLAGGALSHLLLNGFEKLEKGLFGTSFPFPENTFSGKLDLILVPGAAFDRKGNRLGYGGGYYDRFLMEHPDSVKIGLAFPFQVLESLPVEPHDCKMDIILTSEEAIIINPDIFARKSELS